jgi:hypothetical protein
MWISLKADREICLGLTVDISDPFGSLDAWYNDLNADDQARSRNSYSVFKSILRARYANQGLF